MTMTNIGTLVWPYKSTIGLYSSVRQEALDATQTRLAWPVQFPKTGNIDSISLNFAAITSAQSVDLRIERINTSGEPDGTAITNGTATIGTPATGWNTFDFATDPAVTAFEFYFLVLQWTSDVSQGDLTLGNANKGSGSPYLLMFNGTWNGADANAGMRARILYDDATYPFMACISTTAANGTATNYGDAQAVKESGIRFRLPFRGRLCALMLGMDDNNVTDKGPFRLYEDGETPASGGTIILQVGDIGGGENDLFTNAAGNEHLYRIAPRTLEKDRWYRLTADPGTNGYQRWRHPVDSNAQIAQAYGTSDWYSTNHDDSSWTDEDTQVIHWYLVFDQIDTETHPTDYVVAPPMRIRRTR